MRHVITISKVISLLAILVLMSCRGQKSTKPPIHLNPNMDNQEKYRAFGENPFFEDGRNMRPLPEGTIPRGHLMEDEAYYQGKVKGELVNNPVPASNELLARGRERYDIFCSACHSRAGDGKGIVVERGFTPATSFYEKRLNDVKDGHFFDVMTNGVRTMPSMRKQVPVDDRWAIVWYIRALQKSRNATINDVPEELRESLN